MKLTLNRDELARFRADNGHQTHMTYYDLTEDSVVMDIGGYKGVWIDQIIKRYNPNVYLIEPVSEYYEHLKKSFKDNEKVHVINCAVSNVKKDGMMYVQGDSSSIYPVSDSDKIKVNFNTIDNILNEYNLQTVDLLQVNIEGSEYDLFDYMFENNLIHIFKTIQVQFHLGIDNCIDRKNSIDLKFKETGFEVKYSYPFVWECWSQLNNTR